MRRDSHWEPQRWCRAPIDAVFRGDAEHAFLSLCEARSTSTSLAVGVEGRVAEFVVAFIDVFGPDHCSCVMMDFEDLESFEAFWQLLGHDQSLGGINVSLVIH